MYITKFSLMYERRFWIFEACANFFFYISYSDKYVYSYIGIVWRVIILSVLKSKFNDVIGLQDFFEQLRFFWLKRARQSELFHLTRTVWGRRTALIHLSSPSTMWAFHGEIAKSFKEKYSVFIYDIFVYWLLLLFSLNSILFRWILTIQFFIQGFHDEAFG